MSLSYTQRFLNLVIPAPVSRLLRRHFDPELPLRRRLLAVVPAGVAVGMCIEVFMANTGFYPVLTRKEGERRAEAKFREEEFQRKREERKQHRLAQQQQQATAAAATTAATSEQPQRA